MSATDSTRPYFCISSKMSWILTSTAHFISSHLNGRSLQANSSQCSVETFLMTNIIIIYNFTQNSLLSSLVQFKKPISILQSFGQRYSSNFRHGCPLSNLVRNSVVHSPSSGIRDPRYGNVSTCSSSSFTNLSVTNAQQLPEVAYSVIAIEATCSLSRVLTQECI